MRKKGFTLIEMIIVIVIIGILAAAILPKILGARDRAEDVAIKSDLKNIATALEMYYMDNGTYAVEGGGWRGKGIGWIFYQDNNPNNYPKSIINILIEQGYLQSGITAKGGSYPTPPNNGIYDYMLYLCENNTSYSLSANLNNPTEDDIAYIQTTCNGASSYGTYIRYGMNYAITGGR